jgi:predicted ATPase
MLLSQITLKNVLSFKNSTVELRRLNVLIGANTAGKSNLIEAIGLLQAAPIDLHAAILRGGGVRSWIWMGETMPSPVASLECHVAGESGLVPLVYHLEFSEDAQDFVILNERLEGHEGAQMYFQRTRGVVRLGGAPDSTTQQEKTGSIGLSESVLARFKSPVDPTPITNLGNEFERIKIFREFRTGPFAPSRYGISTSVPTDFLHEGGGNLALVLQEMDVLGRHERILDYLRRLDDRFEDVKVRLHGSIAQTHVREAGVTELLPAIRLSDGTLRFLCLLAVLLHPNLPALVCLEEPEIGLHPEALQIVADALIEASERTQLIVTTHSEALVDALSQNPESVLVCERDFENSTQFRRLTEKELDTWLDRYTLGELWRKGEIGGTRW